MFSPKSVIMPVESRSANNQLRIISSLVNRFCCTGRHLFSLDLPVQLKQLTDLTGPQRAKSTSHNRDALTTRGGSHFRCLKKIEFYISKLLGEVT